MADLVLSIAKRSQPGIYFNRKGFLLDMNLSNSPHMAEKKSAEILVKKSAQF